MPPIGDNRPQIGNTRLHYGPQTEIQVMRHTAKHLRNRIRKQKIGKKLVKAAKAARKAQRAATK